MQPTAYQRAVEQIVDLYGNPTTAKKFAMAVRAKTPNLSPKLDGETRANIIRIDVSQKLENDQPLEPHEKDFLLKFLISPESFYPKKSKGRQPAKNGTAIIVALQLSLAEGLQLYRGDFSPAISAIDAVADAFKRLGMRPNSYSGVKAAMLAHPMKEQLRGCD